MDKIEKKNLINDSRLDTTIKRMMMKSDTKINCKEIKLKKN